MLLKCIVEADDTPSFSQYVEKTNK